MNERELIGQVLAGDPVAERVLYDAHVDRVFRLVYRMAGDMDRAQDWVQETFIRAFDRLAGFRGESALSTWLCSIAISVSLNGLRQVRRARETASGFQFLRSLDRHLFLGDTPPPGAAPSGALAPEPDVEPVAAERVPVQPALPGLLPED